MRNDTIKQDTSLFMRGIKDSVKEKDGNAESCRGQLLSAAHGRGPQAGGTCRTLSARKAPCWSQECLRVVGSTVSLGLEALEVRKCPQAHTHLLTR